MLQLYSRVNSTMGSIDIHSKKQKRFLILNAKLRKMGGATGGFTVLLEVD